MRRTDTYETKTLPNYKIFYNSSNNNLIYSSSTQKYNNISRIKNYISSEVDNSTLKAENKRSQNNIYLSSYRNNSTTNHNKKTNTCLNIYQNNNLKTKITNNENDSRIDTSDKYISITNIPRRTCALNMKQKQEIREANNYQDRIYDYNLINSKKNKKLSFMDMRSSSTLNNSIQKNNHSFFEVKSLKEDFLGHKKNKLTIKIKNDNINNNIKYLYSDQLKGANTTKASNDNLRKNNTNKFFNINYNINNNINLIINSKKVKYFPRNSEITFNKNKISFKNIATTKLIKHNTKRHELSSANINKYNLRKINSYYFSYIPKTKTKNELFENKSKKIKKKMNNEKRLILKNINSKAFEEDFPIKLKYNRQYRINKKLKPQIALRLTLFKISKLEIERYFVTNFFFSENLRMLNKNNSECFFEK